MRLAFFIKRHLTIISLFLVLVLCGMRRIHTVYDTQEKIQQEFDNIFRNAQDEQFKVVNSSQAINAMKDGQFLIYSTGTVEPILHLRLDTTMYILRMEKFR